MAPMSHPEELDVKGYERAVQIPHDLHLQAQPPLHIGWRRKAFPLTRIARLPCLQSRGLGDWLLREAPTRPLPLLERG